MKSLNPWYTFFTLLFAIAVSHSARAQDFVGPVLLWAETSADAVSVTAGDTVTFTIVVTNDSAVATATNPVVTITLPDDVSNILSPTCASEDPTTLSCPLSELPPKAHENLTVIAKLNSEGHNFVEATISADQENSNPMWQFSGIDSSIVVVTAEPADTTPVDLSVEIDILPSTELNLAYPAVITIKNLHQTNTAIAPAVELMTPDGWTIWPSKHCDPTGRTTNSGEVVRCITPPLPPESESEINLSYTPRALDGANVLNATAASSQPDENETDNTIGVDVSIAPRELQEILCGASNPMCFGGPETTTDNIPDNEQATTDNTPDNEQANTDNTPNNEPSVVEPEDPSEIASGDVLGSGTAQPSTTTPKDSSGGSFTPTLLFLLGGLTFCCSFLRRLSP